MKLARSASVAPGADRAADTAAAHAARIAAPRARLPRVLLAGNPNAGKTTLFNLLTGATAKVGNYPGVTVDRRVGCATAPGLGPVELVDLPGTYSLSARSPEEQIAVDALLGRAGEPPPDAVVVVLDATSLGRGLYLAQQVAEAGLPLVLAVNVLDELEASGRAIDLDALARAWGASAVGTSAARGRGREALLAAVAAALDAPTAEAAERAEAAVAYPEAAAAAVATLADAVSGAFPDLAAPARRVLARWLLLSVDPGVTLARVPAALTQQAMALRAAHDAAHGQGALDLALVGARYARIDATVRDVVHLREAHEHRASIGERLDAVLTHRVWGLVAFAVVMALVFQALFSWAEPLMGAIEAGIALVQGALRDALPPGPLRDLLTEGVVAGVGNVVVFVPQIALLFVFVGFLEDSGYLARVAFVIDRVMGGVGLHGRAFVPMLSGFACAVPAVMATRTLESRRDRLLTMMVVPLMACSARLPVFVLLTAAVFDADARVLGVLSVGAVVLFGMYGLSVVGALAAATVLRRTVLTGPAPTLLLELPSYRLPVLRDLARSTWTRVRSFLVDAGTIILAMTIVLWALLSYPVDPAAEARYEAARAEATRTLEGEALEARTAELEGAWASERLRHSAAGRLGRALEPALEPLGLDWRLGVGILGAFAAREVFVSTLGVVFGFGEADETSAPLRDELRRATWPDGRRLLTPLVGVALMVFFVFAAQCMSTLAVIQRESGSWRWAAFAFVYMTALAYVAALAVYQGGRALGLA